MLTCPKLLSAAKGKMGFRKESKRKAMNEHICAIRGLSIGSLLPPWNKSVYLMYMTEKKTEKQSFLKKYISCSCF